MDRSEIRELLLVAAAGLIGKVMDAVDHAELDSATLREPIDVAGTEWHLVVTYNRRGQWVQVQGATRPETQQDLVAQLFGSSDGFNFIVPAGWVPVAAREGGAT